ncbi:unnamed protein product [Leuciscus chuanchicus]
MPAANVLRAFLLTAQDGIQPTSNRLRWWYSVPGPNKESFSSESFTCQLLMCCGHSCWPHKPASSLRPSACVGGIVVSIAAFQAVDPGSIPGQRIAFCTANSFCNSWLEQNFCMGLWAAVKDLVSPSRNRTPVFRVTGGDTVHYTNEELQRQVILPDQRDCSSLQTAFPFSGTASF